MLVNSIPHLPKEEFQRRKYEIKKALQIEHGRHFLTWGRQPNIQIWYATILRILWVISGEN